LGVEQILNYADSALYAAKAAGRNCLRKASADSAPVVPAVVVDKA